jgi:hypothetical protein
MSESPQQMADRIEAEAQALSDPDQREYGLMVASVIRKDAARRVEPNATTGGRPT